MMNRGRRVTVKVFGGRSLKRVVWQDLGRGVLLCTPESYAQAVRGGTEPVVVGFPTEDVESLWKESSVLRDECGRFRPL